MYYTFCVVICCVVLLDGNAATGQVLQGDDGNAIIQKGHVVYKDLSMEGHEAQETSCSDPTGNTDLSGRTDVCVTDEPVKLVQDSTFKGVLDAFPHVWKNMVIQGNLDPIADIAALKKDNGNEIDLGSCEMGHATCSLHWETCDDTWGLVSLPTGCSREYAELEIRKFEGLGDISLSQETEDLKLVLNDASCGGIHGATCTFRATTTLVFQAPMLKITIENFKLKAVCKGECGSQDKIITDFDIPCTMRDVVISADTTSVCGSHCPKGDGTVNNVTLECLELKYSKFDCDADDKLKDMIRNLMKDLVKNYVNAGLSQTVEKAVQKTDCSTDSTETKEIPAQNPPSLPFPILQCAADYGTEVGGPVCCGQSGIASEAHDICPHELPVCKGLVQGKSYGTCHALPKCEDGRNGHNYCREWCGTPGVWTCGYNRHNDYQCDCAGCNKCVISTGTESSPYCSWEGYCSWNEDTKKDCADAVCKNQGYDGGKYVASINNPCSENLVNGEPFSYMLKTSSTLDAGKIARKKSISEAAIRAQCSRYLYGTGQDNRVYRQLLNEMDRSSTWEQVSKKTVGSIAIIGNAQTGGTIYAVASDQTVLKQSLSSITTTSEWQLAGKAKVEALAIYGDEIYMVGTNQAVYKQRLSTMTPSSSWGDNIAKGDVIGIYLDNGFLYGVGTNNRVYRQSLSTLTKKSSWGNPISKGSVRSIAIDGDTIYGVGGERTIFSQKLSTMTPSSDWTEVGGGEVPYITLAQLG